MRKTLSAFLNVLRDTKGDIDAVHTRDPAARGKLYILCNYPGIHARLIHRVAHKIHPRHPFAAMSLASLGRFWTGIEIHPAAKIGKRFFIDHGMGVVIGETAVIGDDVTLYQGVTLGGVDAKSGKRHPTLEDGVVVGAGAKILGDFAVGRYAKVGSNAVVVKPVAPHTTVIGVPAKPTSCKKQQEAFAPYGQDQSADPAAQTIERLLAHIQVQDARLKTLELALCKLDPSICIDDNPKLHAQDLDLLKE